MKIQTIRYFNIDIALGACANLLFFTKVFDLEIDLSFVVLLFNSVWIIYTLDRLLDTRKSPHPPTNRHRLHKRFEKPLFLVMTLLVLFNLFLLVTVSPAIVIGGTLLGVVVLGYLGGVYLGLPIPKEIAIAAIYTLGIALVPIIQLETLTLEQGLLLMELFLLALVNLIVLSWYEKAIDEESNSHNFAATVGKAFKPILWTIVILFSLTLVYLFFNSSYPVLLFGGMMVLLLVVYGFPLFFERGDRYRLWADAVFLLPVLVYLN